MPAMPTSDVPKSVKSTWLENWAGTLPALMMAFLLSTMFVFDAREEHYIGGDVYITWLQNNAVPLRIATPVLLIVLFSFSAVSIVKNWRVFAIFPEFAQKRLGRAHFLWPFSLLYITYFGTVLAYGHYVWLHEACVPSDSVSIAVRSGACYIDPDRLTSALGFSGDQFTRGVWGDFWELVGPTDPAHAVQKDTLFILVTGFYRLLAQTALLVIPASIITGAQMLFRQRT
jgi:hypothetical protein